MFNFADIFQFVVNGFNNRSFSEKYFIPHCHQTVLHIAFDAGNQVQPILKKQFTQGSRNIPFVAIEFTEQLFAKRLNDRPVPVIHMGRSNAKMEQFAFIIDYQMEFEAIEPAHCAFANGCHILKNTVPFDPFIFANGHFSGIDKGNTRAFAKTNQFQKQGKGDHNFSFKFNETVVRKQIGKFFPQMFYLHKTDKNVSGCENIRSENKS
jgi:hypothetical protein